VKTLKKNKCGKCEIKVAKKLKIKNFSVHNRVHTTDAKFFKKLNSKKVICGRNYGR
jgi:hypothetical protein